MIAKGGYSDQATGPSPWASVCMHIPLRPGCPARTWAFFLSSPNMPTLMRKKRSKLWGGSMGKAVLWEGKRQVDSAALWL